MKKTDQIYVYIRKIIFLLGVVILLIFCLFYIKDEKRRLLFEEKWVEEILSVDPKIKDEGNNNVKKNFYDVQSNKEVHIFDDNIKTQKEENIFDDKQDTDKYPTVRWTVGTEDVEKEVDKSTTVASPPELSDDVKVKMLNRCMTRCYSALTEKDSEVEIEGQCLQLNKERDDGQKVISFSFYGDLKSAYYNGISENLKTIDEFYPGWLMRLYLDSSKLDPDSATELCDLSCSSDKLDLCPVKNVTDFGDISGKFGMVWRFLPLADPSVDAMASRDLDSRFTLRETAAVQDWLNSNLPFHVMRDNPYHGTSILGGMWDARMDLGNREEFTNMIHDMLNGYVWPVVKNLSCVHDAYNCRGYPAPNNRPWPTKRLQGPGNFVGSIGEMEVTAKCPEACRPKDHLDWELC